MDSTSNIFTYNSEVGVICCFAQAKFLLLVWSHAFQHAVKNMVVPLILGLVKRTKEQQSTTEPEYFERKINCGLIQVGLTGELSLFQFAELNFIQCLNLYSSSTSAMSFKFITGLNYARCPVENSDKLSI